MGKNPVDAAKAKRQREAEMNDPDRLINILCYSYKQKTNGALAVFSRFKKIKKSQLGK